MATNIKNDISTSLESIIKGALAVANEKGQLPDVLVDEIEVLIPNDKKHGDFSTNIAMKLAKQARKAPFMIADIIIENAILDGTYINKIEKAGPGFINFYLDEIYLYKGLDSILKEKHDYGTLDIGEGTKVLVEYVSANPTGPLHMGNARGGALGDLIASVLDKAGYDVTKEFYVNDAGNQIEKFGKSLEARYIQAIKGEDAIEFPEDGYMGEDIKIHAKNYIEKYGEGLLEVSSKERRDALVDYALVLNVENIKNGLEGYGITFDNWFSEKSLYESKELDETIKLLESKDLMYENEGARWFKTTEFGVDKDDVLVRNNGLTTYFASDIAYHRNKFIKREFDWCIDLLGADHHGHVARMKAACEAIGVDKDRLEIVVFQLVRLMRNGEVARMSKRTGKAISLTDLVEEVGKDAVRFFFNMKASGSHLDFDLELAKKQSNDNPVFYVQYAHARICSILRKISEEGYKVLDDANLKLLEAKEEKALIEKLLDYPEEIRLSAKSLEPSRLTRYVHDLASDFHSFYNACRVMGSDEDLMQARIKLIEATKIVINNVLTLMKISAPQRM